MRKALVVCALLAPAALVASGVSAATAKECGAARLLGATFDSITVQGVSCKEGKALLRIAESTPTGPISGGKQQVKYGPYRGLVTWMTGVPVASGEHDFIPVLNVKFGTKRVSAHYHEEFFN